MNRIQSASGVFAFAGMLCVCAGVQGAIVSTSGSLFQFAAPASVLPGDHVAVAQGLAFDERQGVAYAGQINGVNPILGMQYPPLMPAGGTLAPGTLVNSHYVHFDSQMYIGNVLTPQAGGFTGTVTFDTPIVGLIFEMNELDASDGPLGAVGTVYPTGIAGRQSELGLSNDNYVLLSAYTLSVTFENFGAMDNMRVLTLVPGPTAGAAMLALGLGIVGRRRRS